MSDAPRGGDSSITNDSGAAAVAAAAAAGAAAVDVPEPPAAPHILQVADVTPSGCKWIEVKAAKCRDAHGRDFTWEYVRRSSKHRETDGSAVLARVRRAGAPDSLLVIAQYRPPLQTFVLELPAGVIERNETPLGVALRELREETGFREANVLGITAEAANDQGLTNSCLNFAVADVDADAPGNADPQPTPELGETILVLQLPLEGLADHLTRIKRARGWAIDSRLLAFALGLEFLRGGTGGLTAPEAAEGQGQ